MTLSYKPVILTFALIVLLFYFIGITESALAQLSASITINNAARTNNSSNNSECFSSSVVNIIRIPPKIVPNVLPPKIVMIYGGKVYHGELSEAKFRGDRTFGQLHIQPRNLTANLPSKIVRIREGSCVQFAILGTPRLLPPSSLGVTVYDSNNGTAVKVLNVVGSYSAFRVNLARGNYILLAVGTWLPGSEHVSGYTIYKFVMAIVI
jgi:hypothetical protein